MDVVGVRINEELLMIIITIASVTIELCICRKPVQALLVSSIGKVPDLGGTKASVIVANLIGGTVTVNRASGSLQRTHVLVKREESFLVVGSTQGIRVDAGFELEVFRETNFLVGVGSLGCPKKKRQGGQAVLDVHGRKMQRKYLKHKERRID